MADHVSSSTPPSIDYPSQTRSVEFSPSEIHRLQARHNLSLYAKILGRRVRYDHFCSHIRNVFKPIGNLEVISLKNDFFFLNFSDPSDYQNALQNGPWTINHNYIALIPWTPNFKPSETSVAKTKVWIRLYELPVEYYDKEALSRIAEEIAPLVKIDPVTETMSKCKFARFCVDLDLLHPLIDSVKLPNGFLQKIRYERLRYYQCWGCRLVGHAQKDCPESASIATQEVRQSWGFPGVLDSPGEARTPPGDSAPDSPAAAAGSGFDGPDISRAESPGESRTPPGDTAPEFSAAAVGLGFDDPDISRVDSSGESRTHPFDATPDSPAPRLSKLQVPDQEASFIDSGTPCVEDNYFPNVVCNSQELMTPGSKMKHLAILRGVVKHEVMFDQVEMQEKSNAGLPKVFEINEKVCKFSINVMIYSNEIGNLYQNTLIPVEIDHTPFDASLSPEKQWVLFFNCRGARDPSVIRALKDLVEKYGFSVVVLTETKTGGIEARNVIGELSFSGKFIIEPVDNSGGVWLLWDENRINVDVQAQDQHYLYALAQVPIPAENLGESWFDVELYGVDDS